MRRAAMIAGVAGLALLVMAPGAAAKGAKGEPLPATGSVSVTGPGLTAPISLAWSGYCADFTARNCSERPFGDPFAMPGATGDFWAIATASGAAELAKGYHAIELPPPAEDLGPKYLATFAITLGGDSTTIRQDLYPFASPVDGVRRGAWTFTPPGQHGLSGDPNYYDVHGGWWAADPGLVTALRSHGLPSTPPSLVPAPAGGPLRAAGGGIWPFLLGFGLLLSMVAAAIVLGRPRRRPVGAA